MIPRDEAEETLLGDLWWRQPDKATLLTTPAIFRKWVLDRGDNKIIALGHLWCIKHRKGPAPGTIELYAKRWKP
jgi:hypothetical protein